MILLIDNYDSFTYNLFQYLSELGAELEVVRNDKTTLDEIEASRPAGIVISPGPSTPLNAGISGITCDVSDLQSIVLCNRSGILKSGDGGKSYKLVYRSRGAR